MARIDENANISTFGIKFGSKLFNLKNITALELVKKILVDSSMVVDAQYITKQEYDRDYGDDE